MPLWTVDWPKPLELLAVLVRSVCRRDENHISLIALHILQILYKLRLRLVPPLRDESLGMGVVHDFLVEEVVYQFTLFKIQRDDSETFLRVYSHVFDSRTSHLLCFNNIPAIYK